MTYPPESDRYSLPARSMPSDALAALSPWIAGFVGLSPAVASQCLRARWSSIQGPALLELCERLLAYEVREIVASSHGGTIFALRPNTLPEESRHIGNGFYLPGPMEPAELDDRLRAVGQEDNASLREFLAHFAGLAEDDEGTCGNFVSFRPWETLLNSDFRDWADDVERFSEWKHALMLYCARDGCRVLVHPTGKVAWFVIQEHYIYDVAPDFDGFLRYYAKYLKVRWPFDPYGPPDYAVRD